MGFLDRKIDCCGSNFENNNISPLGLLLLSFPYVVLFWMLFPLTVPMHILKKKKSIFSILLTANNHLIRSAAIYPKLKCSISAKVFKVSPFLSGWIFKKFNFVLLLLIWLLFLFATFGAYFLWY